MFKTRIIWSIMLILSAVGSLSAKTETFTLTFSESDFTFETDSLGRLSIYGAKASYPKLGEPALPYFSERYAIDSNLLYESTTATISKRLIRKDVTVAEADNQSNSAVSYTAKVYPENSCDYMGESRWADISVLHYMVSPFVYDASTRELYFIDKMDVTLNLKSDTKLRSAAKNEECNNNLKAPAYARAGSLNPLDSAYTVTPATGGPTILNNIDQVEYVIITSEQLKPYFEPLAQWKTTKGVPAAIFTVGEIDWYFPITDTSSLQLKIKRFLRTLYNNKGLKYALLGGDTSIVPAQGCYGKARKYVREIQDYVTVEDKNIPADSYYACFGGSIIWDGNGNGIYGETDDDIDFTHYINVTRAPFSSAYEVNNFVAKILEYEKTPIWNNKILTAGTFMYCYDESGRSDAENQGDKLFFDHIYPWWTTCNRIKYYDTLSELYSNGKSLNVTGSTLDSQLKKGYSFVDIITHGNKDSWSFINNERYSSSLAKEVVNSAHTIITTAACSTNEFDAMNGECLSRAFLSGKSNRVVAYLGASRESWVSGTSDTTIYSEVPAVAFNAKFYDNLLLTAMDKEFTHFGEAVAAAKFEMIGLSKQLDKNWWTQLALNGAGDPEMPIYIDTPKVFTNVGLKTHPISKSVMVKFGLGDCRVCLMSSADNGLTDYRVLYGNDSINIDNINTDAIITITKPGYIPYQIEMGAFKNDTIAFARNRFYINAREPESSIRIRSIREYAGSYDRTFNDSCAVVANIPLDCVIELNKEDFIPKWFRVITLQNETLTSQQEYNADLIVMGSNITNIKDSGRIFVKSGTTTINSPSIVINQDMIVNQNATLILNNN